MTTPDLRPDLDNLDQRTALDILTHVKQGVPPEPEHIPYTRVGREDEERRLCDDPIEGMDSVSRGGGQIFFVLGDFGYGKSFFINLLAHRASNKGFVRSEIDIPDIGTLSNKSGFYQNIVRNLEYPNIRGTGVVALLREFCQEFNREDFERVAVERGFSGHSFYQILKRLLEAKRKGGIYVERDDTTMDFGDVLDGASTYLRGGDTSLPQLHAIGKTGHDHITNENEYEYLRHIRSLALELGHEGFVVLIDEVAEEMDWNPDSGTTQRLIDLYNKCYQRDQFSNMMFVFVGNRAKWDELIEKVGHQALEDRYNAKRLVLGDLQKSDYVVLVTRIARLVGIGYSTQIDLSDEVAERIVSNAIDAHGSVGELSPRKLLLKPQGETGPDLVELLREYE